MVHTLAEDVRRGDVIYPFPPHTLPRRPSAFHRLQARAAIEGMSMSDYLSFAKWEALDPPTRQEVLDRLRARPVRSLSCCAADVIRAERTLGDRPRCLGPR
jgi:hypothetical protein